MEYGEENKHEVGEKEPIRPRREEESKGGLFSIWNILIFAMIISLIIATVVLRILGVSPVFLAVFLLIQFYLLFTGKSTKEIVKKIKERLKEYEGEQLDFTAQASIAKSFYDVVVQYKYVRYIIVLVLSLLTAMFTVMWLSFGIIVSILFIVLIILVTAYYATQYLADYLKKNFVGTIEKDPPHLGLLTVLGEKKNIVLKEGFALKFPPVIDFIPIRAKKEILDLEEYTEKEIIVFSKDNVKAALKDVTLVYAPDFDRLIEFVEIGKHEGAEDALEDLILAHLRGFARQLDIEDIKDEKNEIIKEGLLSAQKKVTDEILKKITGVGDKEIEENLKNGIPDDHLLGIKVFRFSIGPVMPKGDYAKNLEQLAKEKLQRKFETFEARTEGLRAITYFMSSRGKDISKMTPEDIENYVSKKIEEDPTFKADFMQLLTLVLDYKTEGVIPGLGDRLRREGGSIPLDMIGGLLSGLIPKPSAEKKPRKEKSVGGGKSKKTEEEMPETEED